MYRRIALTIALAVGVLSLSLVSSDSTVRAQGGSKLGGFAKGTGVVTLGPNQVLRITVALGEGTHEVNVRFRTMEYSPSTCSGGVCVHTVTSQTTSAPVSLAQDEAVSIDIANTSMGVRGMVLSNSQDVRVIALIIDTTTGKAVTGTEVNDKN